MIVILASWAVETRAVAFPADPDVPDNTADWIRPFLGYQYTYDDNLFRLPSASSVDPDPEALLQPGATKGDRINTVLGGVDGHWIVGRQSVDYGLEVDHNRFDRNGYLDNTSGTARGVWNWSVASNLSGQLGADYTRSLTGFADTFFYVQDVVDREDYFGSGRYQIGPRWAVYGTLGDTHTQNSAFVDRFNNFDSQSGKAGVEFATSVQNTVGWEYRFTHGHYPQPAATLSGVPYDPDYNENSGVFVAKYVVTPKTTLSGDAGYLRRDYAGASPVAAFSGEIWHGKLQWQATDKTAVLVTAGRDLQAYIYAQSDYFVQDGVSVAPTWNQSDKLTWTLTAAWYRQNYINSPVLAANGAQLLAPRHDNLSYQQIGLTYTPYRWLLFNFMYHHEERSSNQSLTVNNEVLGYGYSDNLAQAGVKFRF